MAPAMGTGGGNVLGRVRRAAVLAVAGGVALAALAAPARAWDPFHTQHGDVEDGRALLKEGKAGEALEAFEEAREEIPERPELHYDMGLAHFLLGDQAQAVKDFERALERIEPLPADAAAEARAQAQAFKADVLYALGTAYAAWAEQAEKTPEDAERAKGRWEQAVHNLERALRLEPGNESALRNLELALLRYDPPCSARNDEYEPNDDGAAAKPLEFPEGQDELDIPLKLCPEEQDWFTLPVRRGDRVFAELTDVTAAAGTAGAGAGAAAKPGLALLAADGETKLRPAGGDDAPQTKLSYQEGQAEGDLKLRVTDHAGEEADYHLKVRVLPACERLDDAFEDNDEPAAARPVGPDDAEKLAALRVCPTDDDWFAVDLAQGESLVVIAQFDVEKGTPSLAIADAAGNVLAERTMTKEEAEAAGHGKQAAQGAGGGAPLLLSLLDPPPGRYLVATSGSLDVEAAYQLQLKVVPPCPEGDDPHEDNDDPAGAKPLAEDGAAGGPQAGTPGAPGAPAPGAAGGAPQPQLLRICAGDEDWFRLTAQPDKKQVVSIGFDHARGDLDLALYADGAAATDEPAALSARSSDAAGAEGVALPEVEEETPFLVRVFAPAGANNFYLLQVTAPQGGGGGEDQQEKQDEQDQQEKQDQEQKPDEQQAEQPEPKPEERDAMEELMDQLDRNPRNLEAERARRQSPFRDARPARPW